MIRKFLPEHSRPMDTGPIKCLWPSSLVLVSVRTDVSHLPMEMSATQLDQ